MKSAIRLFVAILLAIGTSRSAFAQGAVMPSGYQTLLDAAGKVVSNGCIWVWAAGTTTPINTFTDSALSVANLNPIRSLADGRYVAFLTPGVSYKFQYESNACNPATATHGTIYKTVDNVLGVPISAANVDVTGTAGESISANNAVYLSDGSGGKTAGQWYRADSVNAYSSSLAGVVGMAPSAIASAASGTVRVEGQVTGLSSLSVGSPYYISTSGAITTTAPSNVRFLGTADSATSIILASEARPLTGSIGTVLTGTGSTARSTYQAIDNGVNDFRLTLTTGTPVTTSDVTAATTIYLTPYRGNRITLYDSSGNPETCSSVEKSIAVPATTSTMYDLWAYDSTFGSCTVTLEALAWTNDTTRASAIVLTTTGVYTKTSDLTRRYVGSFRTTTVSGQTEDSVTKRYLFNAANRVDRVLKRFETNTSWTYASATIRQANASTSNQVDFVIGVAEDAVQVAVSVVANSADFRPGVGIGLDSTTTIDTTNSFGTVVDHATGAGPSSLAATSVNAQWLAVPAVGRHFLSWNEYTTGGLTATFFAANGTGNATGTYSSGLLGRIRG